MHWTRRIISYGLPIILISLLGCQTKAGVSGSYKPTIPVLAAPPLESACVIEGHDGVEEVTVCITVTKCDWTTVVTELKASCLALGHSKSDCGVKD